MKLKTSSFNLTLFKKNLTRFAPLWAIYLIGMMMVLFEFGYDSYDSYDRFARNYMAPLVQGFGIVNLIYAGILAVVLFGDLYNTRMCYSLHTQPARREMLLLNQILTGLCFSLVPNLVATGYLMIRLQEYWYLALYWLLASEMQFVFYFGVATVSALLVGNRFAMLLVYAGLNFVSMLAYWVISSIYLPLVTGVILNFEPFSKLCPTVDMIRSFEFFTFRTTTRFENMSPDNYLELSSNSQFYQFEGLGSGWGYLTVLLGVGVALMGLAVLLYRMRQLETAGDFVAFPKLKNVACVIMTVCVDGMFAFFAKEMIGQHIALWVIAGLVIGFFGSLMLLERRVKVFRGRTFLGFALMAVAVFSSYTIIDSDLLGIERWTPDASKLQSVTISNYLHDGFDDKPGGYYDNRMDITITDPEAMAEIITAHQDILNRLDETNLRDRHCVTFTYKLKSGRVVKRVYAAPADGKNHQIITKYFVQPKAVLGFNNWEQYVDGIMSVNREGQFIPSGLHRGLLEALRKDCVEGYVVLDGKEDVVTTIGIYGREGQNFYRRTLQITSKATNTLAILKMPEAILGYDDWDQLIRYSVVELFFENVEYRLEKQDQTKLLQAMLLDCEAGDIRFDDYRYGVDGMYYVNILTLEGNRNLVFTESAKNTMAFIEEYREKLKETP